MKAYSLILWITAGLLLLKVLNVVPLLTEYYFTLRLLVTAVALYSMYHFRHSSWLIPVGLLLIGVCFNPIESLGFTQQTERIISLATVASFIRLGMLSNRSMSRS